METRSEPGIVAAGHDAAADAAAAMLEAGGNAFDAVLAAGFASTVCEPGFTSLAGGGFLLAIPNQGRPLLFDFFVDTPGRGRSEAAPAPVFEEVLVDFGAAVQAFHCGPGSVAVPGVLAGYLEVHRRLGRLPLAEVVEPAAELAERGVAITPTQAGSYALLEAIMGRTAASRAIYQPRGRAPRLGEVVRNPDLAQFLRGLGVDPSDTFYRGERARHLVAQLAAGGGLLTVEDLAAYQVVVREPLRVPFRGRTVLTNPPPSFGGSLLGRALARWEALGPAPTSRSAEHATALVRVMAEVDAERRATERGGDDDRPVATRGTTHVTVVDGEGSVASMTTSNGECSGDVIEGIGVSCNNMLGEDDLHPDGFHAAPAGLRVASMMSPTVVLGADGRPELALGSGGSKRIRSALLQVLVAVVDGEVALADAVDAPRLHWDEDHIEAEPGFGEDVLDALERLAPVNRWPERGIYFGGVHAVVPGEVGAGDPRRGGAVRVVGPGGLSGGGGRRAARG